MRKVIALFALAAVFMLGCSYNSVQDEPAETTPAPLQYPGPLLDENGDDGFGGGNEEVEEGVDLSPFSMGTLPVVTDEFDAQITRGYAWRDYMPGNPNEHVMAVLTVKVKNNTDAPLELAAQWMGMRIKEKPAELVKVSFAYRSRQGRRIHEAGEQPSNTVILLANEEIELQFVTRSAPSWEPRNQVQFYLSLTTAEKVGKTKSNIMQSGWFEIEETS